MTKENNNELDINVGMINTEKKLMPQNYKDITKKLERFCPDCNAVLKYSSVGNFNNSVKFNRRCRKCSQKGDKSYLYGKKCIPSEETKRKISISLTGRKLSEDTKQKIRLKRNNQIFSMEAKRKHSESQKRRIGEKRNDVSKRNISLAKKKSWKNPETRKKYYDALSKTKWIKVRTDRGQLELIEKWNKLGFNFEPNYQLKVDDNLFYLDGYDKERNVVLEYDGQYHNKTSQKQKDLVRQNKIIEILKPKKFWRYNRETNLWLNIME
jgi:hypothetical protein